MSKLLDQLLLQDVVDVQRNLPTGSFEVLRLSEAVGEPVVFHLSALPYGKVQDMREREKDSDVHILLAGCPDLREPELMAKFGAPTPAEAVKALLLPGEIADLSREVERLSGFRRTVIQEVKNA